VENDLREASGLAIELRQMRVQYNELKARHEAMSVGKGTPLEIQLIAIRAQKEKLEKQLSEQKKSLCKLISFLPHLYSGIPNRTPEDQ
jgi:hypothetical protein